MGSDGVLVIDFVGRFENLQSDFDRVCDRMGIEQQPLPHKNVMNRKQHYTEFYDDESQALVKALYHQDIEYFGYEFGT
ncbi:MAG: sulfotransferase family protein [Pseudanabaenales cyanobacterium]|nr:sulfotransferase family protein [Pseudanabaenales cyanobacterium]